MKLKTRALSKLLGVSTNTIREYENSGLISAIKDSETGYRTYDEDSVTRLISLKLLRDLDFSLTEIGDCLLNEYTDYETAVNTYTEKMTEIETEIERLKLVYRRLKDNRAFLQKIQLYGDNIIHRISAPFWKLAYRHNDSLIENSDISYVLNETIDKTHMYFFKQDDFINNKSDFYAGCSIKRESYDKISREHITTLEAYPARPCLIKIVRLDRPLESYLKSKTATPKELLFTPDLQAYFDKNNLHITDDVFLFMIGTLFESGKHYHYYMLWISVDNI